MTVVPQLLQAVAEVAEAAEATDDGTGVGGRAAIEGCRRGDSNGGGCFLSLSSLSSGSDGVWFWECGEYGVD